jgi:uncharacterized protein YndB with AHSA1/START domain
VSEVLTVRRTLSGPRDRVFAAWTRPELIGRWFFPEPGWTTTVEADVRVGGRWRLEMRDLDGGRHVQHGVYRLIEPVSRLAFTWSCEELGVADSLVTVELADRGPRTDLVLRHELLDDETTRRRHGEGWDGCLERLEELLENHGGEP